MATVTAGEGMAFAALNRNEPAFYCVQAHANKELMDLMEDLELTLSSRGHAGMADTAEGGSKGVQDEAGPTTVRTADSSKQTGEGGGVGTRRANQVNAKR